MSDPGACAFHHATPATGECAACEKPVCDVCTKSVNTHAYCRGCGVDRAPQHAWLAAIFSLLMPGAGQVYNGDWAKAALCFFTAPLILPWLWGVYDATVVAARIAAGRRMGSTVATGPLLLGLKILWVPMAIAYFLAAFGITGAILSALAIAN